MQARAIEITVCGVRMPTHDALPAFVMVGPSDRSQGPYLAVHVGSGEGHALHHELNGQETTRSQAVALLGRVVDALGGRVTAARLVSVQPGVVTGALAVDTPAGRVDIRTEPGQALAASVQLGVPLLADAALFGSEQLTEAAFDGPLASFLETLDLSGLSDG